MGKELKRKEKESKEKKVVKGSKEQEGASSAEENEVTSPINDEVSTPTYQVGH